MWRHLVNEYETNTSVWLVGRLQVEGLLSLCIFHYNGLYTVKFVICKVYIFTDLYIQLSCAHWLLFKST